MHPNGKKPPHILQHVPYESDEGWLLLAHPDRNWQTQTIQAGSQAALPVGWEQDGYASMALFSERSGKQQDVRGSRWLWVDLDVYKTAHEKGAALAALEAFRPQPTVIIDSGGGLYGWWLLQDLCTDQQAIESRNRWLMEAFREFGADAVWAWNRVLRWPGSQNLKTGQPRTVRTVRETNQAYPLDAFLTVTNTETPRLSVDPTDLPPNFEAQVKDLRPRLWARIFSENTARQLAGAQLTDRGRVDRSRNDVAIATQLLRPPFLFTSGMVAAVLSHSTWFSGERYRDLVKGGWGYVEATVGYALKLVQQDLATMGDVSAFFVNDKFNAAAARDAFMHRRVMRRYRNQLYYYDPDRGRFTSVEDFFVEQVLAAALGTRYISQQADEVKKQLLALVEEAQDDGASWINVENGLLNLHTRILIPHTPAVFTVDQLPVTYEAPDPRALAKLDDFVHSIIGTDNALLWWEFVGHTLTREIIEPGLVGLIGLPRTGKSQLLYLLQEFLGPGNYSSVDIPEFAEKHFSVANVRDKRANIVTDSQSEGILTRTNVIKIITSGEDLEIGAKYEQDKRTRITAKLFFAMNHRIAVRRDDEGWYRRLHMIPCEHQWSPTDVGYQPNIGRTLGTSTEIRTAVLWRALEGLDRLRSQKTYTATASSTAERDAMRRDSDAALRWWLECTEPVADWREASAFVYEEYCAYAKKQGTSAVSLQSFVTRSKELMEMGLIPKYESKQALDSRNKKNKVCWIGIKVSGRSIEEMTFPLPTGERFAVRSTS